jgi:uncharacterized protein YebE (UPF0316 family)
MTNDTLITALLIVLARTCDVSIGTIRMVSVVSDRRTLAVCLGFFEVLIWIFAVSAVVKNGFDNPILAVAYATGFATGNFVGMAIERRVALGDRVLRIFSKEGHMIAASVREAGQIVTEFEGRGRSGTVTMLFIECPRRKASGIIAKARELDPASYIIVDDTRAIERTLSTRRDGGWRTWFHRK